MRMEMFFGVNDPVAAEALPGWVGGERWRQLQVQVDEAFENPAFQTDTGLGNTLEQLQNAERNRQRFQSFPDDAVVELGPHQKRRGEVAVERSCEYPSLMRIATKKMFAETWWCGPTRQWWREWERKSIRHEREHTAPGLAEEGLVIHWGVCFYRDLRHGNIGITPFFMLSGKVTMGVYRAIMRGPSDPSASDLVELGLLSVPSESQIPEQCLTE